MTRMTRMTTMTRMVEWSGSSILHESADYRYGNTTGTYNESPTPKCTGCVGTPKLDRNNTGYLDNPFISFTTIIILCAEGTGICCVQKKFYVIGPAQHVVQVLAVLRPVEYIVTSLICILCWAKHFNKMHYK